MFLVAFRHGLRASELTGFTRDAVRDGYLDLQRLKGSLHTIQPLCTDENPLLDEKEALLDWCARQPRNQPVFNITRQHFWRLFQRYSADADIPAHKRHPHVLKHSIAKQTIGKAGIEHVRQWLGHKSIASTGEYLKVSDDDAAERIEGALKL